MCRMQIWAGTALVWGAFFPLIFFAGLAAVEIERWSHEVAQAVFCIKTGGESHFSCGYLLLMVRISFLFAIVHIVSQVTLASSIISVVTGALCASCLLWVCLLPSVFVYSTRGAVCQEDNDIQDFADESRMRDSAE